MSTPITGDPYPNGKCPPDCKCMDNYWDYCCESLEHLIEDYIEKVRVEKVSALAKRPSKALLSSTASHTYWCMFGDVMSSNVDSLNLHLPFPVCMSSFHDNVDAILSHLDEVELEELAVHYRLPIDEDDDDYAVDEDAIDMSRNYL